MPLNFFKSTDSKIRALESAANEAESSQNFPAAVDARKALAALDSKNPGRWLSLAEACRKAEDPVASIRAYKESLKHGAPPESTHLQIGAVYVALEEQASAAEHFKAIVEVDPKHADALCMLGVVMNDLGRFDEAVAYFERALAENPSFSEAHFNLGLAKFETADFAGASQSFTRCVELRRGLPWDSEDRLTALTVDPALAFEPMDMGVNTVKLRHDCEQLEYLLEIGRLPAAYAAVLEEYRYVLRSVQGCVDVASLVPFDHDKHPLLARTYKRPVHIAEIASIAGPLINPELDFRAIEDSYLAGTPNVAAIDSLLTPLALAALRRFCRESTIWNNIKPGYLGAYFYDGFCSELLLRLASELRAHMPRVIRDLPLQMMWGFKCDATLPGLGVHADAAAVNVNFWITEDDANLNPDCGGLLVYEHDAPKDWGFRKFNNDPAAILEYLESIHSVPQRIPYRANRAVIFDSDLFHATDRPHFREGYLNRRINITFLYGARST